MKTIRTETTSDNCDCETCGWNYAEGGSVYVDDVLVLEKEAIASCYGGSHFSQDDLLVMALHKLGISVYIDGDKYHVCSYDEEYHGVIDDRD